MEGKPLEKTEEGLGEEINNMHMNLTVLKTPTGKTAETFCLLLTINTVAIAAGLKNCWKLLRVLRSHGKHFFFKDNPTWFMLKNKLNGVGSLSAMQFGLLIMCLEKGSALKIGSLMPRLAFFPYVEQSESQMAHWKKANDIVWPKAHASLMHFVHHTERCYYNFLSTCTFSMVARSFHLTIRAGVFAFHSQLCYWVINKLFPHHAHICVERVSSSSIKC